jgi:transcriptional regulator with XRE-family HTH domain
MTAMLIKTIQRSGHSLYSIAKATGIDKSALGKFMSGKQSLRLDKADALAAYLGLKLVATKRAGKDR